MFDTHILLQDCIVAYVEMLVELLAAEMACELASVRRELPHMATDSSQ